MGLNRPQKTLHGIQALRAFAAISVAAYHALQWRPEGGFEVGRAGVDVFFVISGFIMWTVTSGRAATPAGFLWRRFTRVAPAYWLVTLITAAIVAAWPPFLENVHPEWRHTLLSLAFVPHFDPKGLPFPLLPPGWTLNYEALFYLLFAAGLMLPERRRLWAVSAALAAIAAAGLLAFQGLYELGANPMLLQFAVGMLIARARERGRLPSATVGGALAAGGVLLLGAQQAAGFVDEVWRPLLWGVPAAMIVAGAVTLEARLGPMRRGLLSTLGDASYAVYLVHMPVTAAVAHTIGYGHAWPLVPVALASSIAAGLAWRAAVEKPIIGLARGLGRHRGALSPA